MNDNTKILIVDDNPKNLQVLGKILNGHDYNIEFAMDGETALDWISSKEFDLVLLDINMPGMDGFEVCNKIRSNPDFEKMPVIFLSAESARESILKGFEAGAQDYITKPFDSRELVARVKTQIEIKKSRDEILRFSEILKTKNKLITSSIQYAQLIQKAIQIATRQSSAGFRETFSLSMPKDLISGDFTWFYRVNDNNILAGVFDCTGHGVPGAFMSILGITLLNEIVIREACLRPDLILGKLRNKIIEVLGQKGRINELKDGMDGTIICFDNKNKTLSYAGAYSRGYILRNGIVHELNGDRMPLSYHEQMDDFSLQEIAVVEDDIVYLLTDGYADQFGGPDNRKFGRIRFRKLLMECNRYSMADQKKILIDKIKEWKGDEEQTDDIVVVGIKL